MEFAMQTAIWHRLTNCFLRSCQIISMILYLVVSQSRDVNSDLIVFWLPTALDGKVK